MREDAEFGCLACGQCIMLCPTRSITVSGRGLILEDLMDLPPAGGRATPDQLEALAVSRRAIRKYTPEPVTRAQVDRIVRIISTAPMGLPPSEVGIVVFHGHEKVKELSKDVMGLIERTMKFLGPTMLAIMRPTMSKVDYVSMRDFVVPWIKVAAKEKMAGGDPLLYGAPLAILFHRSPYSDTADSSIAATYAMLTAESMELGTCLIGMLGPFLARDKSLKAKYGIPAENKPELVLIAGHPHTKFEKGVRRRLASVRFHGESGTA